MRRVDTAERTGVRCLPRGGAAGESGMAADAVGTPGEAPTLAAVPSYRGTSYQSVALNMSVAARLGVAEGDIL